MNFSKFEGVTTYKRFNEIFVGEGYDELFAKRQGVKLRTIIKGSKNSKKSFTVAFYILYKMLYDKKLNTMVLRKNRADNLNTTFATLRSVIDIFIEYNPFYASKFVFTKVPEPKIVFYNPDGNPQTILFESLTNAGNKLSGIVPEYGYFALLWIEEPVEADQYHKGGAIDNDEFLHNLSVIENSLDRGKDKKVPFETIFTFNPWCGEHALIKELGQYLPDDIEILSTKGKQVKYIYDKERNTSTLYMTTNYLVNEFLKDSAKAGIEQEKVINYDRYLVSGLGLTAPILNDPFELYRDNITFMTVDDFFYRPIAIGIDIGSWDATTVQAWGLIDSSDGRYDNSICFKGEYFQKNSLKGNKSDKKEIDEMAQEVATTLRSMLMRWSWKTNQQIPVYFDGAMRGGSFISSVMGYLDKMGIKQSFYFISLVNQKNAWNINQRVDFWFNVMSIKGFLIVDNENFHLGKTLGNQKIDYKTGERIDENMDAINAAEYAMLKYVTGVNQKLLTFKKNRKIEK